MPMKITLDVLEERLSNWFAENKRDHEEIIKQTTKTNGTVKDNREEIVKIKQWQGKMIGGLIILNVIVWPIALLLLKNYL